MKNIKKLRICYYCGQPADTKEHIPPKSFFPTKIGSGLKLKTVSSCKKHNNDKSMDDQYLLAHICLHAAKQDNLAKQVFVRSVLPSISRSEKFRQCLIEDSIDLDDGARMYVVDISRFDNFFDHLSYALYFDRYGSPLDDMKHKISHAYLSLINEDSNEKLRNNFLKKSLGVLFTYFENLVANYEADKISESIYKNKIIDPCGKNGSITIKHTFYGIFDVVTLLSKVN